MNRPCVSVIIPTFNRAQTLPRAVESIIRQTFSDWELVVVDDGSNDATSRILSDYQALLGDKLIWIRQANRGCSAARNRGIELSRGEFVAFLDSDDEFHPDKLARQVGLLSACPDLSFAYSDYSFVDLEGRKTESALTAKFPHARTVSTRRVGETSYAMGSELFDVLLRGYFIATIVGMVRGEALATIRFHEHLSYAEEWLFYLRLARVGRAGFVDEPLALHHYTPDSLTRTNKGRNLVRQCQLFHTILKQFPDLNQREEAVVFGHLKTAYSQLANHYQSAGESMNAVVASAKSRFFGYKAVRNAGKPQADLEPPGRLEAIGADQVGCLPAR